MPDPRPNAPFASIVLGALTGVVLGSAIRSGADSATLDAPAQLSMGAVMPDAIYHSGPGRRAGIAAIDLNDFGRGAERESAPVD